jgi:hypothetical protein
MTALVHTTDPFAGPEAGSDAAPLVRWEPCAAFVGPEPDACATCGWLADDHSEHGADAEDPSGLDAIVVAMPTRPALRRAS